MRDIHYDEDGLESRFSSAKTFDLALGWHVSQYTIRRLRHFRRDGLNSAKGRKALSDRLRQGAEVNRERLLRKHFIICLLEQVCGPVFDHGLVLTASVGRMPRSAHYYNERTGGVPSRQ